MIVSYKGDTLKNIKIGFIILIIFIVCFSSYYKYNEGKDINGFLQDFLDNPNYVSYSVHVNIYDSNSYINSDYFIDNKNMIYDLFNYLMKFDNKKYNDMPKNKKTEIKESNIFYTISISAKDSQNTSNIILIDIDKSNLYSINNNYNKKFDEKFYYLNKDIDNNTIINICNKYNIIQ